jgi:hypothetical protein
MSQGLSRLLEELQWLRESPATTSSARAREGSSNVRISDETI